MSFNTLLEHVVGNRLPLPTPEMSSNLNRYSFIVC